LSNRIDDDTVVSIQRIVSIDVILKRGAIGRIGLRGYANGYVDCEELLGREGSSSVKCSDCEEDRAPVGQLEL
jgi:hypothetical protein